MRVFSIYEVPPTPTFWVRERLAHGDVTKHHEIGGLNLFVCLSYADIKVYRARAARGGGGAHWADDGDE